MSNKQQVVFVARNMQCDRELIYIGIAANPMARIVRLQDGNPFRIELMCTVELESAPRYERIVDLAHDIKLAVSEFRTRENWFECSFELVQRAIGECNGQIVPAPVEHIMPTPVKRIGDL